MLKWSSYFNLIQFLFQHKYKLIQVQTDIWHINIGDTPLNFWRENIDKKERKKKKEKEWHKGGKKKENQPNQPLCNWKKKWGWDNPYSQPNFQPLSPSLWIFMFPPPVHSNIIQLTKL